MTASVPVKEVSAPLQYTVKYTFATLVTRLQEYNEMVRSAEKAGFSGDDIEFIYIDNTVSNQFDGFSGFNRFMQVATGRYLIYCHQDLLFEFDQRRDLDACIDELDQQDRQWAVCGNAGKDNNGVSVERMSDPLANNRKTGSFPSQVISLDENFIVVDRQALLRTTGGLTGFHLYGADICFNARQFGLTVWAVDFHLRHKSAGKVDQNYQQVQVQLMKRYHTRLQAQVIQAMCSRFYVSSSALLMVVFNWAPLLKLHKSVRKRINSSSQR